MGAVETTASTPSEAKSETQAMQAQAISTAGAFDTADLWARLKSKVVVSFKEPLKAAVGETLDWAAEGLLKNENKFVKGLGAVLPALKPSINELIDAQL